MYICVEGNIGAGKTTFAKNLAKQLKANFLAERFKKNSFLPLFYRSKMQIAFHLEYSFLSDRYVQLNKYFNLNKRKNTIADFFIYKCLWFAKCNLSKKEYAFYKNQFYILEKNIPKPDLVVYINTSAKNLLANIKERGRAYENSIEESYLTVITKNFDKGILKLVNTPVLEINVVNYSADSYKKMIKATQEVLKKGINFKYQKIKI